MKKQWLIAAGFALFASFAIANSAFARDTSQDEHSIRHVESAICDAFESSDADALRSRLDDHFSLTDSKGVVTDRDQTVASVARRDPAYLMFRNHDQKVRLYGDSAIVTGITTTQGHDIGGSTFAADYAYTDTWVYVDGHWLLAASQATCLRNR